MSEASDKGNGEATDFITILSAVQGQASKEWYLKDGQSDSDAFSAGLNFNVLRQPVRNFGHLNHILNLLCTQEPHSFIVHGDANGRFEGKSLVDRV